MHTITLDLFSRTVLVYLGSSLDLIAVLVVLVHDHEHSDEGSKKASDVRDGVIVFEERPLYGQGETGLAEEKLDVLRLLRYELLCVLVDDASCLRVDVLYRHQALVGVDGVAADKDVGGSANVFRELKVVLVLEVGPHVVGVVGVDDGVGEVVVEGKGASEGGVVYTGSVVP